MIFLLMLVEATFISALPQVGADDSISHKLGLITDDNPLGTSTPHSGAPPPQEPERWVQQCEEIVGLGEGGYKQCGTRNFEEDEDLAHGEASVGEFPWTCVLLNQNDKFLGTCAIIPRGTGNDNGQGTNKVITAASKLKLIQKKDKLKVRVGHYTRSISSGETQLPHKEYTVIRIKEHELFDKDRLRNNIALLKTETNIDMSSDFVNSVCLPSCKNQFDFTWRNGTGSRCWVVGRGDSNINKSSKVQLKVDVPLVEINKCNNTIINTIKGDDKYALHSSELCAGGEEGKDACAGDGGSPLVCQAESGRWTLVGLVSWGVGKCGKPGLPGVYVNIANLQTWIQNNNFERKKF